MPALCIHSKQLDSIYRAYLLGRICDREFSYRVDALVTATNSREASKLTSQPLHHALNTAVEKVAHKTGKTYAHGTSAAPQQY